mmetsp:Transcript_28012/g.80360  ORF Transcript_28012/g.80360 Transcript_28012/m.80360 type:complete len:781 (-) Transcript_28012:48-2390(-)
MGELFEVLGSLRFSPLETCPPELRGKVITLRSVDDALFQVPAEAACISGRVRRLAAKNGVAEEIPLPLKKTTVAKVVDYMKHHKDIAEGELVTPLISDDLVECGVTRWDAKFVDCDKMMLFDLNLTASLLDMAGLFFLTSAKAAILFKDKSSDHLRKQFNLLNDLPRHEEETMSRELQASGKAHRDDAGAEIAALAVALQATAVAAEKHGCLEATRTEDGVPVVDLRSWRHATWRAAVLLDWKQLGVAPAEVRGDRDLLFGALMVSQGLALQYASPELRSDKKLVLEATKYSGMAFREAADELRGDRSIVLEAIAMHPAALAGATDALRGDRHLVLEAATNGYGAALQGATRDLQRDGDFVLQVVSQDPHAFKYAAEELRNDRNFAMQAATNSGRTLQHMPSKFQADREIVAAAVGENVAAALFAHTSRRGDLGIELPWDSQLKVPSARPGALEAGETPGGPRMLAYAEYGYVPWCAKLQKSVQFSAMSVMMGNMGQANYVAANAYLDKLPAHQRPEIEAVTLMWGAVGNIGMRWKAFASQDMMNATPDALLSIIDASMVLQVTCCKMDCPEWYNATLMDIHSREYFLTLTSGGGSGGGFKPSESQAIRTTEWRADGLGKGFLLGKDLDDDRVPAQPNEAPPLGGWPGLATGRSRRAEASGTAAAAAVAQKRRYELEIGARVQLVGLTSKNGATGVLLKCFADGKWKVRLDDGSGNALLKGCYMQAIESATEVAKAGGDALQGTTSDADARRSKAEARKCRLNERVAAADEVDQRVTACA